MEQIDTLIVRVGLLERGFWGGGEGSEGSSAKFARAFKKKELLSSCPACKPVHWSVTWNTGQKQVMRRASTYEIDDLGSSRCYLEAKMHHEF
eukprot:1144764-Pelagomonas_calceolata.AAC.2